MIVLRVPHFASGDGFSMCCTSASGTIDVPSNTDSVTVFIRCFMVIRPSNKPGGDSGEEGYWCGGGA